MYIKSEIYFPEEFQSMCFVTHRYEKTFQIRNVLEFANIHFRINYDFSFANIRFTLE